VTQALWHYTRSRRLKTHLKRALDALDGGQTGAARDIIAAMLDSYTVKLPGNWPNGEHGRKTIAVDFDGVLHSYKSGWCGVAVIPDEPVPGAFDWLREMVKHYRVMIFSARCNDAVGVTAMRIWFETWGLEASVADQFYYEPGKPSAWLFIDDRAKHFYGSFAGLQQPIIERFRPWYYGMEDWDKNRKDKATA
jgi:hypothetical protein